MRFLLLSALVPVAALSAATFSMDSGRGNQLFVSQGCVQCHQLKGMGGRTAPDLGRVLDRAYTPAELVSTMWNHAPTMWSAIKERSVKVGDIDEQAAADLFAAFYSARYFEMRGDAGRGKRLFKDRSCENCHGLTTSPNPQARPVSQWQSLGHPVMIVSAMWNHSPDMWNELSKRKIPWPALTPQDMTDLLVYLRNTSAAGKVSPEFRITAGENGARLFESKGCGACHKSGEPSPSPLTLTAEAAAMWNHASFLHLQPPRIEPDEMRELLSYSWAKQFFETMGSASRGKRLFTAKQCARCHSGSGPGPDLSKMAGPYNGITMMSALWRHGPAMLAEMK
ncbi:MAG TPA: c-type cytochrome, partial [Bryobacteraceae bacterium]|nr:c-type cytochrome [Bryobacteraceae bacterium]